MEHKEIDKAISEQQETIFITTACKEKSYGQDQTGDIDYAKTLKENLKKRGINIFLIEDPDNEESFFNEISKKTPKGSQPILHLMLNPPNTGCMLSPERIQQFKDAGGKVVITVVEFAKNIVGSDGLGQLIWKKDKATQKLLPDIVMEYLRKADEAIFLDENDRDTANKYAEKYANMHAIAPFFPNSTVIDVPPTVPVSAIKPSERGKDIISFGMIRRGKGTGFLIQLAQLIMVSNHPEFLSKLKEINSKLKEIKDKKEFKLPKLRKILDQIVTAKNNEEIEKILNDSNEDKEDAELLIKSISTTNDRKLSAMLAIAMSYNPDLYDILEQASNTPEIRNKKIYVVGSVFSPQDQLGDHSLGQLMSALYPEQKEQAEMKDLPPTKLAKLLEERFQKDKDLKLALPIELHVNVPREKLAALFNQCTYSCLPAYRGATLRNTSISSSLANQWIIYSFENRFCTPRCLKRGGEYDGAMVLEGDDKYPYVFASRVLKDIIQREKNPKLNDVTRQIAAKLVGEKLSPDVVIEKQIHVYDRLKKPTDAITPKKGL